MIDETCEPDRTESDETSPPPKPASGKPALKVVEGDLDEDEAEFRALRRDLPGVAGASAIGIVTISVGKAPAKNEFFRTNKEFRPVVDIVTHEEGIEKQYFVCSPDMVPLLASIGISTAPHTLYLTVTSRGMVAPYAVTIRTNTPELKKSDFYKGKMDGCGCTPTWKTAAITFSLRRLAGFLIRSGLHSSTRKSSAWRSAIRGGRSIARNMYCFKSGRRVTTLSDFREVVYFDFEFVA